MLRRRRRPLLAVSALILMLLASACGSSQAGGAPTATPSPAGAAGSPTAITLPAGANQPTATPAPTDTPKPMVGTPTPTITPPGFTPPPTNAATATAKAAAESTTEAGVTATAAAGTATAKAASTAAAAAAATSTPTSASGGVPVTSGSGSPTLGALPEAGTTLKMANSCDLINSSDLAHLFPPHNEITRELPKTSQVTDPPFSPHALQVMSTTPSPVTTPTASPTPASGATAAASATAGAAAMTGTETRCVFYDFHQPGSSTGWMLQVTYLVDMPAPTAVSAWAQTWAGAMSNGQPVSGLGDEAFASGSMLFIKKGDTYLTFAATDTHLDPNAPGTHQQLLAYEKTLAEAAVKNLK